MAKKVVATLKSGKGNNYAKVIKMVKSSKGHYCFKEEIVHNGFTTADEELSFRERVYAVYPTRSTTPIYKGTSIYLITKAVFDGYI